MKGDSKIHLKDCLLRYLLYIAVCVLLMISGFVCTDGNFSADFWLTEAILFFLNVHLAGSFICIMRQHRGV